MRITADSPPEELKVVLPSDRTRLESAQISLHVTKRKCGQQLVNFVRCYVGTYKPRYFSHHRGQIRKHLFVRNQQYLSAIPSIDKCRSKRQNVIHIRPKGNISVYPFIKKVLKRPIVASLHLIRQMAVKAETNVHGVSQQIDEFCLVATMVEPSLHGRWEHIPSQMSVEDTAAQSIVICSYGLIEVPGLGVPVVIDLVEWRIF
mmetsp:Transcript_30051/g.70386  ORF Transcript_30051/g.70386 Transcript_30051/m.70386 type:complete len:203 (+) Transcript_30051:184-792(+)